MIKKVAVVLFMTLVLLGLIGGCGSKSSEVKTSAPAGSMDMAGQINSGFSNSVSDKATQAVPTSPHTATETSANDSSPTAVTQEKLVDGHKIIQTGTISMESLKFDESVSKTLDYVTSIGGYAESSNIQGQGISSGNTALKRTANYIFRVPADKYTDFFTKMKGYGVVTLEQSQGQDITDQYFDTDARLKTLKIQEERELMLLQQAIKLSDILELEKELNSVRYQIESYTGTLRKWDSLVSYSTVKVTIREVDEAIIIVPTKEKGLWARMAYSFTSSMKQLGELTQGFIVLLVALLPFIVVLGVILIVVLYIRKNFKKWLSIVKKDKR
ncbi:DUF4349 domain-containing protein [Desulfosporosinus shakirovi]|uniref:DUF4349 domain-containing protein n=1 Tax=Desulfosporosinus shakirovi TaxID=2885154 RepID=UPI001E306646|nr:DUF4349 domain-containing protein [Desulfosporosinus sp. SRJS8]MCB8815448.1 DUF4349 domain-containing protein [Desulfosporosinus sp. SRJS8]